LLLSGLTHSEKIHDPCKPRGVEFIKVHGGGAAIRTKPREGEISEAEPFTRDQITSGGNKKQARS